MADIDPRLNAIIETALGSPLAPLVVRALARIEALEAQPRRIDEDHDPFAPVEEEAPEDRALRQLGLLDFVVARELKLELELMDRNGELVAELGNAIAEFRTGAAMSVVVIDPADADGRERRAREDLLSGERRRAIEETLEAWRDAVENLGGAIRGTEACARGPQARGTDGVRPRAGSSIPVGDRWIDCPEDRLRSSDAA